MRFRKFDKGAVHEGLANPINKQPPIRQAALRPARKRRPKKNKYLDLYFRCKGLGGNLSFEQARLFCTLKILGLMAARKQRFQDQALTKKCTLGSSARVQPILQAALQPARKAGSRLIESHAHILTEKCAWEVLQRCSGCMKAWPAL